MEAMFRICGIVDNLKLAMFIVKPVMSFHVSVIVPFFVPELSVVPANKLSSSSSSSSFTAIELSLGGNSPYTCTGKSNKNKYA
jgi:hypothetical protein